MEGTGQASGTNCFKPCCLHAGEEERIMDQGTVITRGGKDIGNQGIMMGRGLKTITIGAVAAEGHRE